MCISELNIVGKVWSSSVTWCGSYWIKFLLQKLIKKWRREPLKQIKRGYLPVLQYKLVLSHHHSPPVVISQSFDTPDTVRLTQVNMETFGAIVFEFLTHPPPEALDNNIYNIIQHINLFPHLIELMKLLGQANIFYNSTNPDAFLQPTVYSVDQLSNLKPTSHGLQFFSLRPT